MRFGTEQSSHVLDDDELRAEGVDCFGELGPQAGAGAVLHARAEAGEGHVLAREPAREDVDRLDGRPVDGGDVAVVRGRRVVVGEDLGRRGVELDVPGDVAPTTAWTPRSRPP
jgi:hypothetical protein